MTTTFRSSLVLATLLMACASTVTAQVTKKPVPDPEVAAKVALLKKIAADRKFARDAEGIDVIDFLIIKHRAGMIARDEKLVVKALDGVLNKGKVRPYNQIKIYSASADALGMHGKGGAKVLKKAYEKKRFPVKPKWVPMREKLLRCIGRTKDEGMVKFLIDEARRNPEAALQAAAGEALGNFEESKEKLRKSIAGDLLITYGSLAEVASQLGTNVEAQNAKDRLAALSGKWNDTLKKLTRQNIDTFRGWQEWHNKNKNKRW